MADRKITDLTALTTPASADVLPIVDVSEAAAADKNKKITVGELFKGVPDGTAAAPAIAFESDDGNGIFLSTTDTVGIATNGSSRMTVSTTAVTSTLPVIVPDGTAAAPSVAFTGSGTDTGIYSPGVDQLALATGGTGRLFVDSSGRVGVGTASPSYKLQLFGTDASDKLGVSIYNDSATVDSQVILGAQGSSSGQIGIAAGDGFLYSRTDLTIAADSPDGTYRSIKFSTGGSEKARIDSSGRLGVGTSSPAKKLTVASSDTSNTTIQIANSATGAGANDGLQLTVDANGSAYVDNRDNTPLYLATNSTVGLTLDSSQRVGIGTTAPSNLLHLKAASGYGELRLEGASGGGGTLMFYDASTKLGDIFMEPSQSIVFRRGSTESARLDGSGRLLVGTSSAPSAGDGQYGKLVVQGYAGGTPGGGVVSIQRDEAATAISAGERIGFIGFGDSAGNTFASVQAAADATAGSGDYPGRLVFSTTADGASSPTERMRIHSDGRVSTGTTGNPSTSSFGFSVNRNGLQGFLESFRNAGAGDQVAIIGGNAGEAYIQGNGDLKNTNNSYGSISDIKLKENIVDASSQWDDFKTLQVRNYNFKPETGYNTHAQIGLIAQEVELVSPGLVSESPDRDEDGNDLGTVTKSVNYSVLYMKAVKALQEAMERIETLETKVAALEAS